MKNILQKLKGYKLFQLIDTLGKLGVRSLFRYGVYRGSMLFGFLKRHTPPSDFTYKPSYSIKCDAHIEYSEVESSILSNKTSELLNGRFWLFFERPVSLDNWKNWRFHEEEQGGEHWSVSPINSIAGHDIKLTWDLSRFQWLMESSFAFRRSGNVQILDTIERLITSWCNSNSKNTGVNWVCAQECAIRTIHFIISTELLSPVCEQNKEFISEFVVSNLRRINTSLVYSISQDNNHGVTESAALYIGALFLEKYDNNKALTQDLAHWRRVGRRFLVDRLNKLVFQDGGFAMYSSNYHRTVLNLLVMVKVLEARYTSETIGEVLSAQGRKMTIWLEYMVNLHSGDFPNLGANDGSAPFLPQFSSFRCLKDTLDAANFVFNGTSRFNTTGEIFYFLKDLGVKGQPLIESLPSCSHNFTQSGLMKLNEASKGISVFIKYPVYKYRPSQCDLLHVDIWFDGINLARDLGTYSYNCSGNNDYYSKLNSICSHNSIQFGDFDGMPKLSGFLYSNWAKMIYQRSTDDCWEGAYNTYFGSYHERKVSIVKGGDVIVEDKTHSDCDIAVLRWHLEGSDWKIYGDKISSKKFEITISSNKDFTISLSFVRESRFYMKLDPLTCVEISFNPQHACINSAFKKICEVGKV